MGTVNPSIHRAEYRPPEFGVVITGNPATTPLPSQRMPSNNEETQIHRAAISSRISPCAASRSSDVSHNIYPAIRTPTLRPMIVSVTALPAFSIARTGKRFLPLVNDPTYSTAVVLSRSVNSGPAISPEHQRVHDDLFRHTWIHPERLFHKRAGHATVSASSSSDPSITFRVAVGESVQSPFHAGCNSALPVRF